jgi:hypothetical protein
MSRRNLFVCLVVVVALVNVVNLLPLLDSPYLGDDAWCESTLKGVVELSGITLPKLCWNVVVDYVRDGRWYPAVIYYYPVFYYLDRYLYKLATLLFVLSNIFVFGYFVYLTTSSKSAGLISALLPPLFFQLRFYHDPLLSYYFLMQVEFLLIVVSLIFFTWHLRNGRNSCLVGSLAAYALSMLVYEAFYGFWVMYGVIAYFHFGRGNFRKIATAVLPFVALFVLNTGLILVLRAASVVHYEGIHLNLAFGEWFVTFLKQLVAAVPLSYYALTNAFSGTLEYARVYFANDLFVIFCLWSLAWGLTSLFCADAGKNNAPTLRPLLIMGLGFWVLPAPIVTLSAKYQKELTWGLGYLPVYVSGFGLMMLATFLIMQAYTGLTGLGNRARFGILAGIGGIACLVCLINYNNNRIVLRAYNYGEHYHRALIEHALAGGLMQAVPDGSHLICDFPIRSWDSPAFFKMHAGLALEVTKPLGFPPDEHLGVTRAEKAFTAYQVPGSPHTYRFCSSRSGKCTLLNYKADFEGFEGPVLAAEEMPAGDQKSRQAFFLKYEARSQGLGYAVLGRVVSLKADNTNIAALASDRIYIYAGIPLGYPYRSICVAGTWADRDFFRPSKSFQLTEKDLELVQSDAHGKLFKLPRARIPREVDPRSIVVTVTAIDLRLPPAAPHYHLVTRRDHHHGDAH